MNIFQLLAARTFLVLILFTTLLFTACNDNPAGSDDEEHTEPDGMELIHDGKVIFEYTRDEGLTEHSHMHFHVGEEYLFEVHFLNEDGEHIHDEDLQDYSLDWNIEDEEVLTIEQHDEDGKWSFHLVGVSEGASKAQFLLNHGDHSHLPTPEITEEGAIEFHIDAEDDGDHDH